MPDPSSIHAPRPGSCRVAVSVLLVLAAVFAIAWATPRPVLAATPVDSTDDDDLVRHATESWTGDFDAMSAGVKGRIRRRSPQVQSVHNVSGSNRRRPSPRPSPTRAFRARERECAQRASGLTPTFVTLCCGR